MLGEVGKLVNLRKFVIKIVLYVFFCLILGDIWKFKNII